MLVEYLEHIRSYIRTGHRPTTDRDGARYVDTLAYWKDSYQRLQQETNEQRAHIYRLERELDDLRGKVPWTPPQQSGKRPAPDEEAPNGPSKKKKRTNTSMRTRNAESQEAVISLSSQPASLQTPMAALQCDAHLTGADPGMLHRREAGLLDAIYALQKSFIQSPLIPSLTVSIIVYIISELNHLVTSAGPLPNHHGADRTRRPLKNTADSQTNRESGNILDADIGRPVFSMLLVAMDKLGHMSTKDGFQEQVVYLMVEFLNGLLNSICALAAATTKASHPSEKEPVRRRSTRGKKLVAPPTPEMTPVGNIMIQCNFLLNALQVLRKGRPMDQAVMEGFMFFLLRKIGGTLKVFVFGEQDENWNMAWAGKDAVVPVSVEKDSVRQDKKLAKERQAPYLIWLLERTLVLFNSEGSPSSKVDNSREKLRPGFHSKDIKIQLQQTILKEVLGNNLDEFSKALNEPDDLGLNIEPWTAAKQEDVADLFKAELWRLIGWDCLKGSMEWENQ